MSTGFNGLFVVGGLLFLGSAAVQMAVIHPRARTYRTDLRAGRHIGRGRSPFWQVNVLDPRNYDSPAGRRFYRILVGATLLQATGAVLMAAAFIALGHG
jgi:hypothetical protein